MVNRSSKYMAKFKYLGTTLTDQNCMHEGTESMLNLTNGYNHSVQSLFSSLLLSRSIKVEVYETIILPVFYGCGTWSVTLRKSID
jgi:hypothetical protein